MDIQGGLGSTEQEGDALFQRDCMSLMQGQQYKRGELRWNIIQTNIKY